MHDPRRSWLQLGGALLLALASTSCVADPPSTDEVAVMVLGSYHFTASESDLVSADPGDVRSAKRQLELQRVADALADFRPTVVAVERVTDAPGYADPHFASFSPEEFATSQDERVQLGYRIAHTAGVERVYGIDEQSEGDEPDYFPFDAVMAGAEATGQAEALEGMLGALQAAAAEAVGRFDAMTVAEALHETNTGFLSAPDFYYRLLEYDVGEDQPGAVLNGYWFMRNAKIFAKLMDVTEPGDRVIVVFGAGHRFWLEHLAEQTPGYRVVSPGPLLLKADRGG